MIPIERLNTETGADARFRSAHSRQSEESMPALEPIGSMTFHPAGEARS
jgi:hypothetical protein